MSKTAAEPLVRISKREGATFVQKVLVRAIAILLALVVDAFFIFFVTGLNPISVYGVMWNGTFMNTTRFSWALRDLSSLLCIAIALAPAFKMRFWNIGGEGQFTIGAIFAGVVALKLGGSLPQPLVVLLMAVCGAAGGGLYGVFVAALKVKFNTNETLLTLMLNYIALYLLRFLGETKADWNLFLDPASARPKFVKFPDNAGMITFSIGGFHLNLSLVIAVLLCVLIFVYLKYTKQGYEIAVVGDSPNTARYAGMKVGKIVVRTIFLSAALIGLAGAFYVSSAGTMSTSITNDVGWTGIVVAWLAKLNTVGIVVTSLLITVLQFGCQNASTAYSSIDANFADLIQGIILFAVLAADFFTRFQLVGRAKASKEVSK